MEKKSLPFLHLSPLLLLLGRIGGKILCLLPLSLLLPRSYIEEERSRRKMHTELKCGVKGLGFECHPRSHLFFLTYPLCDFVPPICPQPAKRTGTKQFERSWSFVQKAENK